MAEPVARQKLAFYLGLTVPRQFESWARREIARARWPWLSTFTTMLLVEAPVLAVVADLFDSWWFLAVYVPGSLIVRPLVWGKTTRETRLMQLERKWDRANARFAER